MIRKEFIHFRGATRFEFQFGRFWFTIIRPKFICKGNIQRLITFGLEPKEKK